MGNRFGRTASGKRGFWFADLCLCCMKRPMAGLRIPCSLIRGGTSRAAFFRRDDLPADEAARDRLLVRIMGGPDALQVDGIGGGHPLTSKVAVISPAADGEADLDYLFLQVDPRKQTVSAVQNCGNILAGVGVYAIHKGMVCIAGAETVVRVRMLNSGGLCHLLMQTPNGALQVEGDAAIDGVPGTAAPVVCNYQNIAGSACGALLPTGNPLDLVDGVEVTCIDNGMPVVVLRAADFGLTGLESPEELDADAALKARLEALRLALGPRMNLGDVAAKSVPKLCLASPPQHGGLVMTRTFIPHVCHKAIGVLGAVSVATAGLLPGSVAAGMSAVPAGNPKTAAVEHPSGAFTVRLELDESNQVRAAGVVRTARLLFAGEAYP